MTPYESTFTGGVRVALADINGDGYPDIITAPGSGCVLEIKIFDGKTGNVIADFMAYATNFLGGVTVAAGDLNGDGIPDIVTGAGPGGGPDVVVFDGKTDQVIPILGLTHGFYAFNEPNFNGGVTLAVGDIAGNGQNEITVAAGPGGGPHVADYEFPSLQIRQYPAEQQGLVYEFNPAGDLYGFYAFAPSFNGGVTVAVGDVAGVGHGQIIVSAGAGGGPQVTVFDGLTLAVQQYPTHPEDRNGFYAYSPASPAVFASRRLTT